MAQRRAISIPEGITGGEIVPFMARRWATSIPEDIMAGEIVPRLPVKSVGRCRCVCKRWRSLFSHPDFVKSHNPSSSKQLGLVFHLNYEFYSLQLEIGMQRSLIRVSLPFKNPAHALSFVGSCNGLVACVTGASIQTARYSIHREISLFIWNPLTGFYKEFIGQGFYSAMRGFGYVSATDDYKVIVALLDQELLREVRVFSFKSQTWKSIKCPLNLWLDTMQVKAVFLNEALHWVAYETDPHNNLGRRALPLVIFAFDLAKEEFRKIQVPRNTIRNSGNRLGVSCEGCLYVMCFSKYGYRYVGTDLRVDFCVMREYDNGRSWRSFCIRIPFEFDRPVLEPILLTETCAVVMNMSKKIDRLVLKRRNNIRSNDLEDKQKIPDNVYKIHHHIEKDNRDVYSVETDTPDMVVYEESLSSLF